MNNFDSNDYVYNKDSSIGILLIHGFSSTTYETKFLAKYLSQFGFHVATYNLPGHGTNVDDCNSTSYSEWIYFARQKLAELSSTSDKVFIVGHSIGGAITLHLASIFPVDGIVLGATVLRFKKKFETYFLVPLLNKIKQKVDKMKMFTKEHLEKNPNFGYMEYPLVALNEFRKMNRKIIKDLHKVQCPTLIIHSKNDVTSIEKNVELIYNNISSTEKSKLIIEKSSHHIFVDELDKEVIYKAVLSFIKKHCDE